MRLLHTVLFVSALPAAACLSNPEDLPGWSQQELGPGPIEVLVNDDRVCVRVADEGAVPDELRIFRDGRLRHATPETLESCFIEDEVAEGRYRYHAERVTGRTITRTESAPVDLTRPAVRVGLVSLGAFQLARGGTLAVTAEVAGAIGRVELDASALDSDYEPGAEHGAISDGQVVATYPLSADNTRPTGVYPVVLRLFDGRDELVASHQLEVTYLPEGRSSLRFPTGALVARDLELAAEPRPELAVHSITRITAPAAELGEPRLFDDAADGLIGLGAGGGEVTALRIVYDVPVPTARSGATRLELAEAGTSGRFHVPIATPDPARDACDGDVCRYTAVVPFQGSPEQAYHVQVQVATFDQGWQRGPARDLLWSPDCDGDPGTPLPYCHEPSYMTVRGHVQFTHRQLAPDFNTAWIDQPFKRWTINVDETHPAASTLVVAEDGCGGRSTGYTDENGDYQLLVQTFCPDNDVTLQAFSYGPPVTGGSVAVGIFTGAGTPEGPGDLTKDPADYTVVSGVIGSFNPDLDYPWGMGTGITVDKHFGRADLGPLFQSDRFPRSGELARALGLMRASYLAQAYQRELIPADKLDRINVVLTGSALKNGWNTAFIKYSVPYLVHIPPRGEQSVFPMVHELFHHFDWQTLGYVDYGRFSEPLANVRAAMVLGTSWMTMFSDLAAEDLDYNWNIVNGVVAAPSNLAVGGAVSQGWIWRIAWDLADGTGAEPMAYGGVTTYDGWNGWSGAASDPNNSKLHRVILDYFPQIDSFIVNGNYLDRGLDGPDLVDLLDGMVCEYGMSDVEVGVLLDDVMDYDYLFDHCDD